MNFQNKQLGKIKQLVNIFKKIRYLEFPLRNRILKKKNQREIVELKNMLTEIRIQLKGLNSKLDNRKKDYHARKQVNRKTRPGGQIQKRIEGKEGEECK